MSNFPGLPSKLPFRGVRRGMLPRGLILAAFCVGIVYVALFAFRGRLHPVTGWPILGRAFFKALPAVLLAAGTQVAGQGTAHAARVAVALAIFSVGDAFLDVEAQFPRVGGIGIDYFLLGLGSFLVALLALARAYTIGAPRFEPVVAIATATPCVIVAGRLWPYISVHSDAAVLQPAMAIYFAALAAMFYGAATRNTQHTREAWATTAGSALFLASNAALAFDRFAPPATDPVTGVPRWWAAQPTLVVLALYWAAIALIADGAAASAGASVRDPSVDVALLLRKKNREKARINIKEEKED